MALLVLLFLVVPIAEIYVIIQVGSWLGFWPTVGLMILISVVGAWLAKREGLGILRRMQRQLTQGEVPSRDLVDGFLVLLAGALLLTPGFITDAFAIVLLLPPSRAFVRGALRRRFLAKVEIFRGAAAPGAAPYRPPNGRGGTPPPPPVIDV